VTLAPFILGLVTAQRLGELALAARNTRRLKAQGAFEAGEGHYPLLVLLHGAWLTSLWALGWDRAINLPLLVLFALLQAARVWVIATLGGRWTTRIIILPGAPLVRDGPYRLTAHPNYAVVVAEIAVLPLALGLPIVAMVFSLLNGGMLWIRIRAENEALRTLNNPAISAIEGS